MAFHVACPITCRKICFCALGYPGRLRSEKGKEDFLQEVARVEKFLSDPWLIKARENTTIQVQVPKVAVSAPPPPPPPQFPAAAAVSVGVGGGGGDDAAAIEAASAQVKRVALQKQAAAASIVAEDYARRFESGDLLTSVNDGAGEEQGQSTAKVLCRLCFSGENEGNEKARKMLSCNSCGKKYHRGCLKSWSQNRDLFHWSSWTCPSCRTCEVCRRTGDPNKFMFCKRCDGAYHCYCQQPPHKNVGHGPYLCPKHTKCHSCDSVVPGNGLSVRWFLGYTCCDACGRLFVKGNYCPVCLKVYRDSESTPMVCCDVCQRWVHCPCDGISDAKYMQFQVDGNLQYVCPTCRGECCQVRNLEESVQELWKRRDEADKDLIASLRAAAGLPTQEEIFDISPFSDDEESVPVPKNEYGRSLKFSLKGFGDKSPKKSKEHGKKSSKKKHNKKKGNRSFGGDFKNEEMQISGEPTAFSPVAGSLTEGTSAVKHKNVDEVLTTNVTKGSRTIKIKSNKSNGLANKDETGTNSGAPKAAPKLVIHLGGRSRNTISPPIPDAAPSVKTGKNFTSSKGQEIDETKQVKDSKLREKDGRFIKLKNPNSGPSNINSKMTVGETAEEYKPVSPKITSTVLGKRVNEDSAYTRSGKRHTSVKQAEDESVFGDLVEENSTATISQSSVKDRKPNLKFKIPKTCNEGNQNVSSSLNTINQSPLPLAGKDELIYTRGQRSKRKRPIGDQNEDNAIKDFTDANWILQKLGKDAAGKRVEVHQPSDNTWHRGTVIEISEGTSAVSIALDDGNAKSFELGKQGIRFVSQKQKH
ncbi:hypothetical protein ABFS83_14G165300 [Erythranthe nasuta]